MNPVRQRCHTPVLSTDQEFPAFSPLKRGLEIFAVLEFHAECVGLKRYRSHSMLRLKQFPAFGSTYF